MDLDLDAAHFTPEQQRALLDLRRALLDKKWRGDGLSPGEEIQLTRVRWACDRIDAAHAWDIR